MANSKKGNDIYIKAPISTKKLESAFFSSLKDFKFTTSNTTTDSFEIHYHSFYEIYYFVSGNCDYLVEGKEYHLTPHSLILLSPYVFHGVRVNSTQDYVRCSVHFPCDFLEVERRHFLLSSFPGISSGKTTKEVFYEHTQDFNLDVFFRHFESSQNYPSPIREQYYPIYLEALLAQISQMCQTLTPSTPESSAPDTITNIIHYLNDHLSDHITLDALSEHFYISKYYMNRAFKKATGTTIIDYLIYKRAVLAKQLLLNGISAEAAALQVGFGDYSTFFRAYKKVIGCSPNQTAQSTVYGS